MVICGRTFFIFLNISVEGKRTEEKHPRFRFAFANLNSTPLNRMDG